jgi:DNA-directed RNA polymerase subunit RPC12/RpoP
MSTAFALPAAVHDAVSNLEVSVALLERLQFAVGDGDVTKSSEIACAHCGYRAHLHAVNDPYIGKPFLLCHICIERSKDNSDDGCAECGRSRIERCRSLAEIINRDSVLCDDCTYIKESNT